MADLKLLAVKCKVKTPYIQEPDMAVHETGIVTPAAG